MRPILLLIIDMCLKDILRKKAVKHKGCKFRVIAIGFTKRNNIVGVMSNQPAAVPYTFNTHAECRLMLRYGRKIRRIVIARFGNDGNQLPVDPCPQCAALAASYGITIESLDPK